jgi:integrase
MGRRGNNEGSISKRPDGRWMGRVTMPDDTRKTVYGKTQAEVKAKVKELRQTAENLAGMVPGSRYTTLQQFFDMWLVAKEQSRPGRTAETYRFNIYHHCSDLFGIAPDKLAAVHIQQLYTKKHREGLSGTTIWGIHRVLHNAFEMAVRQGVLLRNPCKMVEAPRKGKRQYVTWTEDEARRFLDAIKGDRYEALFVLALSTGMRQGEVFGLQWSAVDLDRG